MYWRCFDCKEEFFDRRTPWECPFCGSSHIIAMDGDEDG